MKKIVFSVLAVFMSLNMSASDIFGNNGIWGNGESQENNSDPVFGESSVFGNEEWLSARPGDTWATDESLGDNQEPAIPVGEGLLILLAGGAAYAAGKVRRKK